MQKQRFIEDLTPGMEVVDLFLLATAQQAQAKNGPYWRLEFRDATGAIGGKIWSPHSQNYPDLAPGMVEVTARVTSYRDQPELAIESIRMLSEAEAARLDLSLFMPASARPPHEMLDDLKLLAASVLTHEPWRHFVAGILEHPEMAPALLAAPAAKSMHHAFAGGLLEHTLSICRLCMRLCDHYPNLDRQVLFVGALCHDLGKLWELSSGLVAEYTTKGRLIGHISLVLEKLAPLMAEAGLEPEAADHLRHLILSHHGTREFGSPVLPATAEAITLHYADNLDAKLNQVEATLNAALGSAATGWSAYVPALERTLYRAPRTPEVAGNLVEPPVAVPGEVFPATVVAAAEPVAANADLVAPIAPAGIDTAAPTADAESPAFGELPESASYGESGADDHPPFYADDFSEDFSDFTAFDPALHDDIPFAPEADPELPTLRADASSEPVVEREPATAGPAVELEPDTASEQDTEFEFSIADEPAAGPAPSIANEPVVTPESSLTPNRDTEGEPPAMPEQVDVAEPSAGLEHDEGSEPDAVPALQKPTKKPAAKAVAKPLPLFS